MSSNKTCPICHGDKYIEMGDRQTEWGPEAWAMNCTCSGGDPEMLPDSKYEIWEQYNRTDEAEYSRIHEQ